MTTESRPTLESIAETVADGLPVDWEGLRSIRPEDSAKLDGLSLLQEIFAAHGAQTPRQDPEPR